MRKISENDGLRLQHMNDAAIHARQFADGKSRHDLDQDQQLQYALARAVEIVCEAACNITDNFQTENPKIAWKQIKGMRQWLVHAYFKIDLDVLWQTVHEDLPPLIAQLEAILSTENPSECPP